MQKPDNFFYLSCFFCMEAYTSALPLGCTANYGNCSTTLVYILTTRRVPGYPVSYPVRYLGKELPGNGNPSYKYRSEYLLCGW